MTSILVVDDEPQILVALRINLKGRGYEVQTAKTGAEALTSVAQKVPDVVLLDLGLPDMDGGEVIQGLRGWTDVPIVVLTGRFTDHAKIASLDSGADDYVTKPFSMEELMARVRAVLRRRRYTAEAAAAPAAEGSRFTLGPSVVDLAAHTVTRDGAAVRLTPTEWSILEQLLRHPDQLVTINRLLTDVWGGATTVDSGHLRFHIARLRRKLERQPQNPAHILTEHGAGYRYVP